MWRPALSAALFSLTACNLVAGLEEFRPDEGSGAQGQGGTSAQTGGAGATGGGSNTTGGVAGGGGSGGETPVCASHLLLSEVRAAGNDTVELYNPTSGPIDLNGWRLFARSNEPATMQPKWTGTNDILGPGQYFVVTRTDVTGVTDDVLVGIGLDTNDIPSLIELRDPNGDLIDAVCVCATPADCSVMIDNQERCQDKVLESLFISSATVNQSLQRPISCEDASGWVFHCESLGAPWDASATCP